MCLKHIRKQTIQENIQMTFYTHCSRNFFPPKILKVLVEPQILILTTSAIKGL